ncbi:hypothetical protein EDD86DRAFT_278877 [Gorgonomyces haynaldii]|nr:hypothetical protein EDD86DRAFT_278877 [Gorgonomyces haynaldii]
MASVHKKWIYDFCQRELKEMSRLVVKGQPHQVFQQLGDIDLWHSQSNRITVKEVIEVSTSGRMLLLAADAQYSIMIQLTQNCTKSIADPKNLEGSIMILRRYKLTLNPKDRQPMILVDALKMDGRLFHSMGQHKLIYEHASFRTLISKTLDNLFSKPSVPKQNEWIDYDLMVIPPDQKLILDAMEPTVGELSPESKRRQKGLFQSSLPVSQSESQPQSQKESDLEEGQILSQPQSQQEPSAQILSLPPDSQSDAHPEGSSQILSMPQDSQTGKETSSQPQDDHLDSLLAVAEAHRMDLEVIDSSDDEVILPKLGATQRSQNVSETNQEALVEVGQVRDIIVIEDEPMQMDTHEDLLPIQDAAIVETTEEVQDESAIVVETKDAVQAAIAGEVTEKKEVIETADDSLVLEDSLAQDESILVNLNEDSFAKDDSIVLVEDPTTEMQETQPLDDEDKVFHEKIERLTPEQTNEILQEAFERESSSDKQNDGSWIVDLKNVFQDIQIPRLSLSRTYSQSPAKTQPSEASPQLKRKPESLEESPNKRLVSNQESLTQSVDLQPSQPYSMQQSQIDHSLEDATQQTDMQETRIHFKPLSELQSAISVVEASKEVHEFLGDVSMDSDALDIPQSVSEDHLVKDDPVLAERDQETQEPLLEEHKGSQDNLMESQSEQFQVLKSLPEALVETQAVVLPEPEQIQPQSLEDLAPQESQSDELQESQELVLEQTQQTENVSPNWDSKVSRLPKTFSAPPKTHNSLDTLESSISQFKTKLLQMRSKTIAMWTPNAKNLLKPRTPKTIKKQPLYKRIVQMIDVKSKNSDSVRRRSMEILSQQAKVKSK